MSTEPLTWHQLQEALMACTTEAEAEALLAAEKAGANRLRWMVRIQGRIRVLRRERENLEISAEN